MKELTPESENEEMTLKEVCERCLIDAESIIRLVNYGIVDPKGSDYASWTFSSRCYLRIRKAIRLQRDLSINEAGAALAIDLLDRLNAANREVEQLRRQLGETE